MTQFHPEQLYGIVGNAASGKDFVGDLFVKKGFYKVNASDLLRSMMIEDGLIPDREQQTDYANRIRRERGGAYFAVTALENAYRDAGARKVVMTGIYAAAEGLYVQENRGKIIRVETLGDIEDRYQRLLHRADGSRDAISREEFIAAFKRENTGTSSSEANISQVEQIADYTIINDGISVEGLHEQIDSILIEEI